MGASRASIGSTIGTYVLERKLGAGGMAEVYLARRSGPHGFTKRVALKRILPELSHQPELVQMFCDEARVAATLNHPNIAQVIEFGEHDGELFIVMEYVDGVSCSNILRTTVQQGATIPVGGALYVAREILLALACAHEATDEAGRGLKIVHRDVSPSNVLVSRIGNVKLIDFGITRSRIAERHTYPGELKGKLRYMSPEQILGADVDTRSDLFAAGIVLTEMLAGRALFSGGSDLEILTRISRGELGLVREGGVPKDLAKILEQALAHRPGDRFQTAKEFARAIDDLANTRSLRLDDTAIVPHLHAIGLLSSSSGTRPSVKPPRPQAAPVVAAEAAPGKRPPPLPRTIVEAASDQQPELVVVRPNVPKNLQLQAPVARSSGTYRVRTKSGQVIGPLPRSEMLALLATGRISARSNVSIKADGFVQAGSVPALSNLASHPAYRFRDDDATSPAWLERIEPTTVPTVLFRIAAGRLTGLLVAVDGKRRKRIFFDRGDPVFVASTDRDELLGRRLVAARLTTEKAIDMALTRQPPHRLGEALVSFGAIGAAHLVRELGRQLEDRVIAVGSWRTGEVRFYPSVTLEQTHHARARETTLALLARLIREEYPAGDIAALLRPLTKEALSKRPSGEERLPLLELSESEVAIMEHIDGARSLREVVGRVTKLGTPMPDALRAVFIALSAGCLDAPTWRRDAVTLRPTAG